MKRIFFLLCFALPFASQAQKGLELQLNGGIAFIGADPWIRTPILSVAGLYNINGNVAIGTTYATGLGTKFYVLSNEFNYDASLTEIGLLARFTFLRAGKFKMFGTTSIAQVQGKVDSLPDFKVTTGSQPNISLDDSSVGFGFGTGASLNLGRNIYFNIMEFQMRVLKKDFMDMDKGFQGSVGPLFSFKSGISFNF